MSEKMLVVSLALTDHGRFSSKMISQLIICTDCSFFRANLQICVADALRVDHGQKYYPGERRKKFCLYYSIHTVLSTHH